MLINIPQKRNLYFSSILIRIYTNIELETQTRRGERVGKFVETSSAHCQRKNCYWRLIIFALYSTYICPIRINDTYQ